MHLPFDHEKLEVYRESIAFVRRLEPILNKLPKSISARDQLDRGGTSIPLNIAEGNGRFTGPNRCRFFDVARGSALDVLVAKQRLTEEEVGIGKERLHRIVSMLIGLVRANSDYRLHDVCREWVSDRDKDQD